MGAGASTSGGASSSGGGSDGSDTATVALEDARQALAEAKKELVQAVEQQYDRQLAQDEDLYEERQKQEQRSALVPKPGSVAAGQFVSMRSAWQNVGTIELAAPSVEDRKTTLGATLGAGMTDTRRLVCPLSHCVA